MKEPIELHALRDSIADWLTQLHKGLAPGRFRFCLKGGLTPTQDRQGQMATCFAMKIAWQTGIWESWTDAERQACREFIRSFQTEDGYFGDPWMLKYAQPSIKDYLKLFVRRASWKEMQERHAKTLRAETRQSASTLLMVGEKPGYPLPCEVTSIAETEQYVQALDWRNPWGAGSHVSHQLFMLTVNHKYFGQPDNYAELIATLLTQLTQFYDAKTGTWFAGNPSATSKVNGAMKVFSGLQWLDHPYHDARAVLDFALQQPFQTEGCGFLNRLFVVWQALKGVPAGYRQAQVRRLASDVLETAKLFRQPDGAFSFYQDHAPTHYYSAPVSRGCPVSDLHGTTMLVWAIAIALEILGDEAKDGAAPWKAHKT